MPASFENRIFPPRSGLQLRRGIILLGLGLLGLLPLKSILQWLLGGPTPANATFVALAFLLFLPFAGYRILNWLRGLPTLTIAKDGVEIDSAIGAKWANWDGLEPFFIKTIYAGFFRKPIQVATATVVGDHAGRRWLRPKNFTVSDDFQTPIEALRRELNAVRARAVGEAEPSLVPAIAPDRALVGLASFKFPWLTFALLGVLLVIFYFENRFAVTPDDTLSPGARTLFAFGGLNRTAVLWSGEWYRLFTAPFLHANLSHIVGNSVALVLGGWFLERLLGRLWFFAVYAIGALGGSILSLLVIAPQVTAVGASGALMGLFAATFVSGFRLQRGTPDRLRLQVNSLLFLVPSLLPLISSASTAHIGYGAHFGGAVAGAAITALLLKFWPETERIPQLRKLATAISIAGAFLFINCGWDAAANYPKYAIGLIPALPKTQAERREWAPVLVRHFPDDPRSHVLYGEALAAAKDNAGAERELRLALSNAQRTRAIFGPNLELSIRVSLALLLAAESRRAEAKDLAHPVCLAVSGIKGREKLTMPLISQHLCD